MQGKGEGVRESEGVPAPGRQVMHPQYPGGHRTPRGPIGGQGLLLFRVRQTVQLLDFLRAAARARSPLGQMSGRLSAVR